MLDVKIIILAVAALLSFILTALFGKVLIPFLKRLKFGQTIRDIGPAWHSGKTGTPTLGGIMFILGILITFVLTCAVCKIYWPELLFSTTGIDSTSFGVTPLVSGQLFYGLALAFGCGAIGLADDYIIVVKKRNLGLTAGQKMLCQIIISLAYALGIYFLGGTYIDIPFIGMRNMGIWFIPFCMFVIIAMTNAVNITDGVDGLCATNTFFVALFFIVVAGVTGYFGQSMLASILAGSLAGFLVWNLHPAKVFMGDTGSLFLGGIVSALAFGIGKPFLLVPVGIVYILEILSVVLQVTYFKATKGKRLFKMSPIHHHFEMVGWSENKIVIIFSAITIIGAVLAFIFMV